MKEKAEIKKTTDGYMVVVYDTDGKCCMYKNFGTKLDATVHMKSLTEEKGRKAAIEIRDAICVETRCELNMLHVLAENTKFHPVLREFIEACKEARDQNLRGEIKW